MKKKSITRRDTAGRITYLDGQKVIAHIIRQGRRGTVIVNGFRPFRLRTACIMSQCLSAAEKYIRGYYADHEVSILNATAL